MKEKLLISACLLGVGCRYDGRSKANITEHELEALREKYELILICPEIYGGLPTPRVPSERVGERVLMKNGCDVTENFKKGAEAALLLADMLGAKYALLKEKSPSCGKRAVYDGSFSGVLREGAGVTAELLMSCGVSVFSEEELSELL